MPKNLLTSTAFLNRSLQLKLSIPLVDQKVESEATGNNEQSEKKKYALEKGSLGNLLLLQGKKCEFHMVL